MVTRPIGVRPMRTGPCQRKCRDHAWRRGLNNGASLRVRLSRPAMSDPLEELQLKQDKQMFDARVGPPVLLRGDVVNLKRGFVVVLGHLAVFAAVACPPPDKTYQRSLHERLRKRCVSWA
jgi:hypothetical protein